MLLFHTVLEVVTNSILKKKLITVTGVVQEETRLYVFAEDMLVYLESSRKSLIKLTQSINKFSKVAGYKTNMQKKNSTYIHKTVTN